jgi:hypothetical protein
MLSSTRQALQQGALRLTRAGAKGREVAHTRPAARRLKGDTWLRVSTKESGPGPRPAQAVLRGFPIRASRSSMACAIPRATTGVWPPRAGGCASCARRPARHLRPLIPQMRRARPQAAQDQRRPPSRCSITPWEPREPPRTWKRRECRACPRPHRVRRRVRPRWEPHPGTPRSGRGRPSEHGAGRGPRARGPLGARFDA